MTEFPPYPEWPAPDPRRKQERNESGTMKKGSTANPNGRPPKAVRSFTMRQMYSEFITELERPVQVNGEEITSFQLMMRGIIHDAIKGDRYARALVLSLHAETIQAVGKINPDDTSTLELAERAAIAQNLGDNSIMVKELNRLRRKHKTIVPTEKPKSKEVPDC